MNVNLLLDVKLGQPTGSEPITLAQAKSQLKIDFTTDDTLLTALISAARAQIEQYTGISLVEREVITLCKLTGDNWFELPYGPVVGTPVISTVSIGGSTPETLTDFDIVGTDFKLVSPGVNDICYPFLITYDTGYTNVPEGLIEAVLHQTAYLYEHRGDESAIDKISPTAMLLARLHRRVVI